MSQDIIEADCHMSPQRKGKAMWSGKSKKRKAKEFLIPREGELLEGRFEISYADEDHSDGIDDRRGCAAGGAGGCIYFANDLATGREVAIKFYSPIGEIKEQDGEGDAKYFHRDPNYSKDLRNDFEREQKIVEELSNLPREEGKYFPEYIVKGVCRRKRPYYVMEKLQALTPAQYADEKACEKIILEVCRAAQILSNHGMIALDIKPDNIMFRPADKQFVLVDMGLVADKDAYQKASREALEKFSSLSLSAQCGTVGFFSELYSPHHEARMIYAIGGLIDTLFGKRILPEWQEIVFRCRRISEENAIESIDKLILAIRSRKGKRRNRSIWDCRQLEQEAVLTVCKKPSKVIDVDRWEDICFDLDVVSLASRAVRFRTGLGVSGTIPSQGNKDFYTLLHSLSSYDVTGVQNEFIRANADHFLGLPVGMPRPTAKATCGRLFSVDLRGLCVRVRTPVRLMEGCRIIIRGPGILEVDLSAGTNCVLSIHHAVTLLNRIDVHSETLDHAKYCIGELCYLNFSNLPDYSIVDVKRRVYWPLTTRAFLSCDGPAHVGDLFKREKERFEKFKDEVGGDPFVNSLLTSDGTALNAVF